MPFIQVLITMSLVMILLWLYQVKTQNATIVDVGWTLGMGMSSIYLAMNSNGDLGVRIFTAALLVIWSSRLGFHLITARLLRATAEDTRYKTMRAHLGKYAQLGFFALFQVQTVFLALFMGPMVIVFSRTEPLWQWHDSLALICWLIAVVGESIADKQLESFKADVTNRGKTCQRGLWRYSRHPNYFFEWLHWFTYPLVAFGTAYWEWTLVLPAIMLLFLWKLTGIPYVEAQSLQHRSDYAAYQQKTSMLIPWFPKK
jgi:steroid 5-alpha reductase family enzyme